MDKLRLLELFLELQERVGNIDDNSTYFDFRLEAEIKAIRNELLKW